MIFDSELVEGVNEHYKEVLQRYFNYNQRQTELSSKEIGETFQSHGDTRAHTQDTFSQDEVVKMFDNLKSEVVGTYKRENKNLTYTLFEVLRQIFLDCEEKGVTVDMDLSKLENVDIIQKLEDLEIEKKKNLGRLKPKLSPLAPKGGKLAKFDLDQVKKKNKELRKKLSKLQKQYVQMMKEKDEVKKVADGWKEKYEEEVKSGGSKKNEQPVEEMDFEERKRMENEIKMLQEKNEESLEKNILMNKEVRKQNDKLKEDIKQLKEKQMGLMKELKSKVNQTTQFQNLKKILESKNKIIADLRKQLE